MNKNIGIIVGIIVVVGVGYFALSGGETEEIKTVESEVTEEQMVENDETVPTVEIAEAGATVETPEVAVAAGSFETYSAEKVALAADGDVVIFFHATWCPSCRTLNSDLEKNVGAIPAGTTILKADYDTETELKKKYGVTTQHTLVQVDKDGNLIKKWSGGSKLANLLAEIQ